MTTKVKESKDWRIVVVAILTLVGLEIAAMFNGINGKVFSIVIAAIAGLAGWSMPQLKLTK